MCDSVVCVAVLTCCVTVWCVCLNWCVGLCNWLAGRGGRQPQPAQPLSTLLCAHTRAYTFSAMAAGGGDGGWGGGGSKIKLKIKACPESPSARRPAGSRGGCSSSPSEATRAGASCLSVSLSVRLSYRLPALHADWPEGPLPPSVDQRSMGPGGC